jgi:hypothetical protein
LPGLFLLLPVDAQWGALLILLLLLLLLLPYAWHPIQAALLWPLEEWLEMALQG